MSSSFDHKATLVISVILIIISLTMYNFWSSVPQTSASRPDMKPTGLLNVLTADLKLLQRPLGDGSLQSVDLVQAYLAQIHKHDDYLHAMVSIAPQDSLVTRAKILDQDRENGHLRSHLHGIPIILKVTLMYSGPFFYADDEGQYCNRPQSGNDNIRWQSCLARLPSQEECKDCGQSQSSY